MSRRHGQSQHIRSGSGVAIGHQPCEPGDLWSEDGLCRNDSSQRRECPAMLAFRPPIEDEAVDLSARESDPNPAAGHRHLRHRFRDEVVERPVEVGERHVDCDPGDRILGRRHVRTLHAPPTDPGPDKRKPLPLASRDRPVLVHAPGLPDRTAKSPSAPQRRSTSPGTTAGRHGPGNRPLAGMGPGTDRWPAWARAPVTPSRAPGFPKLGAPSQGRAGFPPQGALPQPDAPGFPQQGGLVQDGPSQRTSRCPGPTET
jgi:hypothetical protein